MKFVIERRSTGPVRAIRIPIIKLMALIRFTFNATLALLNLEVPPLSAMARLFCKASFTVALIICTSASYGAEDDLRQRLTEREDKRRPLVPWSTELAGRPLTLSGEYK